MSLGPAAASPRPGVLFDRALLSSRRQINANQVFYWRMLYRKGRLGAATLLPVRVTSESLSLQAPSLPERACPKSVSRFGRHHSHRTAACTGANRGKRRSSGVAGVAGVFAAYRPARQHAYLDCCWRDRPATGLHGPLARSCKPSWSKVRCPVTCLCFAAVEAI